MDDGRTVITRLLSDFRVNDVPIPVKFMRYDGHEDSYVTWMHMDSDRPLDADDELIAQVDYFDFDVYSKGNFVGIIEELKNILKENGFVFSVSRSGPDFYENDTGYYHKTLCFLYLKEE